MILRAILAVIQRVIVTATLCAIANAIPPMVGLPVMDAVMALVTADVTEIVILDVSPGVTYARTQEVTSHRDHHLLHLHRYRHRHLPHLHRDRHLHLRFVTASELKKRAKDSTQTSWKEFSHAFQIVTPIRAKMTTGSTTLVSITDQPPIVHISSTMEKRRVKTRHVG